ncbi:hypothetical protein RFI_06442 [Reticulomyxa filosa]|uniref:AAA+ ATPase domain-containing protein n=1 Tax=Reticulomyxa filosa TaxID=46433 RepID=X6NXS4_RETFI|nr:hypothetical protein RFI_06442 [Reticulomyxa filosa]|eukprot:ETO30683.1 hypothetical protein RFI_06442 [Reticulomyxa filosa]
MELDMVELVYDHPIQYKHEATKNAIEIANELFFTDMSTKEKDTQFCLCKKWQYSKFFLINQDGSIPLLTSNANDLSIREREHLKMAGFVLLCWKEEMNKLQQLWAWLMVNRFVSSSYCTQKKQRYVNHKCKKGETVKIPSNEVILEEKKKRIEVLCRAVGVPETKKSIIINKLCDGEFKHYVLTYDNILKMTAILFSIRSNLPTVLMGETGCGKTALIKYLACATDTELEAVDIHGGIDKTHIYEIVKKCTERLKPMAHIIKSKRRKYQCNSKEIWLFLDEFNTSPDIGWFNELICNRSLDGIKIPEEIKILAACNPYRERKLSAQDKVWSEKDRLAKYVYRVLPLCETVKTYLWQFGSLPDLDERQYILEMIKNRKKELKGSLQTEFDNEAPFIVEQICKSQEFVRVKLQDVAIVSLRDVDRCLKIFVWLVNTYFANTLDIRQCLVISVGICYYYRLNSKERREYVKVITTKDIHFLKILEKERDKCCKNSCFEGDIVYLEILGTSKTLSFQILKDNMCQSEIENFRKKD